jgi:hypothetical protein|tara:strand:+ start:768 stop:908 length:141 start_codon:yes stop_codon:yes gene_type:complete
MENVEIKSILKEQVAKAEKLLAESQEKVKAMQDIVFCMKAELEEIL